MVIDGRWGRSGSQEQYVLGNAEGYQDVLCDSPCYLMGLRNETYKSRRFLSVYRPLQSTRVSSTYCLGSRKETHVKVSVRVIEARSWHISEILEGSPQVDRHCYPPIVGLGKSLAQAIKTRNSAIAQTIPGSNHFFTAQIISDATMIAPRLSAGVMVFDSFLSAAKSVCVRSTGS